MLSVVCFVHPSSFILSPRLTAKCAKSAKENAIIAAKGEIERFAAL
jgi:hypothetical protein